MGIRALKISKTQTERSKITDMYFSELTKEKMITPEEEVKLAIRIKEGDQSALNELISANLRFAVSVAKKYQGMGMDFDDLINEANIGLIEAARRFDHTKGFKFISYAVWWIRQSILFALNEKNRIVRLPMNKVGNSYKFKQEYALLEQQLEREPTPQEVLDKIKVSEEHLPYIMGYFGDSYSIDKKISEDSTESFSDSMHNPDEPATDYLIEKESVNSEIHRILNAYLKPEERDIIVKNFGLYGNKEMTLSEIGMKLNLSKERVRQKKADVIKKLQIKLERKRKTKIGLEI